MQRQLISYWKKKQERFAISLKKEEKKQTDSTMSWIIQGWKHNGWYQIHFNLEVMLGTVAHNLQRITLSPVNPPRSPSVGTHLYVT